MDKLSINFISLIWWSMWILSFLTIPSVLVNKSGRPTTALSWILGLFLIPPIALPCWWLVGRTHLKVRQKKRLQSEYLFEMRLSEYKQKIPPSFKAAPNLTNILASSEKLKSSIFPPTSGNKITLIEGCEKTFNAWIEAFKKAQKHIHILLYQWDNDEIGKEMVNILTSVAQKGVKVRILLDAVGTILTPINKFFKPLREAGGRVELFLPLSIIRPATINFRNHRKIIIIDNREAFIGGMNIGKKYLNWFDVAISIKGPGVDQLQEIFCDDWYFAVGEDIASEADFGNWFLHPSEELNDGNLSSIATVSGGPHQLTNVMREASLLAMNSAKERIWIITPYFIPDPAVNLIFRIAKYRDIDVKIIVPSKSNWPIVRRASRAYYPELLNSGVKIFEYQGMIHAKITILDHNIIYIGSANLDQRSFRLNFELGCFIESSQINAECQKIFENVIEKSVEILPENFEKLPWGTRVIDAALHLLSPVL